MFNIRFTVGDIAWDSTASNFHLLTSVYICLPSWHHDAKWLIYTVVFLSSFFLSSFFFDA